MASSFAVPRYVEAPATGPTDGAHFAAAILEASPDGIFTCGTDFHVTVWSRGMEEISGLGGHRVLGRSIFEVFPFLVETGEDERFRRALAGEPVASRDRPYRIPQIGREGFYDASYSPFRDVRGEVVGALVFVRDITERRRAEQQLQESETRFRTMADAAPVMLWMSGLDSQCWFFNQGWLRFSGRTMEEEIGVRWAENVHPEDFQRCMDTYLEAFNARRAFRMEYRLRRHDGAYRWILDQGTPRYETDGSFAGFIGSCIDVQELKEAQEALLRANEELETRVAERTAALARSNADLEQFAYVASHDLQQPLRMVSSYVQLLERRFGEQVGGDGREFIRFAVEGAERMQRLIIDLLAYSKVNVDARLFDAVDAGEALSLALANLATLIRENEAEIVHGSLPTVWGNRTLLAEVFQNLVANALKYRRNDPPEIRIGAERQNGDWHFTVEDNGIGIDPAHTSHLFQLFRRLHGPGEFDGTGIGLATCRKIVERHGGRIWVESERGRGSAFRFTLPAVA